MAEQVIFGKIDKYINSTSQLYTPVITTNVLLKEPCSIVAPVFLVKQPYSTLRECNYAEYAGFYYWINDVVSISNKHTQVMCVRDPLASFKEEIKKTNAFIAYGEEKLTDKYLVDPRMNPDRIDENTVKDETVISGIFDHAGTVVMRTYAMLDGNTSGVKTYFMNVTTFKALLTALNSTIRNDLNVGRTIEDIFKRVAVGVLAPGSLKDQILDCYWVPTKLETFKDYPSEQVAIGAYITGYVAYTTDTYFENYVINDHPFNLPTPSYFTNFPWLKHPNYFSVQFNHPGGSVDISSPELINRDKLYFNFAYGMDTGDYVGAIKLGPGHSKELTIFSGSFRYDLFGRAKASGATLASMGGKAISMAAGVFGASFDTKSSVTGYYTQPMLKDQNSKWQNAEKAADSFGRFVAGASGALGQYINTGPKVSNTTIAISSNVLGLYVDGDTNWDNAFYISCIGAIPKCMWSQNEAQYKLFCDKHGWPVQNYYTLATNKGYCQCVGACASIDGATPNELSTINTVLNSGIYIED